MINRIRQSFYKPKQDTIPDITKKNRQPIPKEEMDLFKSWLICSLIKNYKLPQ